MFINGTFILVLLLMTNLIQIERRKETMNKKKVLAFSILSFFALAFVTAGLVTNWFSQTSEFEYTSPISVDGETTFSSPVIGGDSIVGEYFIVSNDGSVEVLVQVVNDAETGIEVTYKGNLELTEKTVDFSLPVWEIPGDADKVQIEYTIVGDSFSAEVTEGELVGYELIYYKDNSDRFENPSSAISVGDVNENLPYETDGNTNEYNYCETEEYDTCHGAKIWYVPSDAINGDNTLDWSRASEFYYESKLIQYNLDGELTIYPSEDLIITPEFEFSTYLEDGTYSVISEVVPLA